MSFRSSDSASQIPSRMSQQQSISTRTSLAPAQDNARSAQSSPPNEQQRPYPIYPLPIPPDKLARAVELYGKYRLERGLARRETERAQAQRGYHLNVPGRAGPPSVASHTSSGPQTASPSLSTYEVGTTESVLSFEDNESPLSTTARGSSEFTAFDGRKIKPRFRRRLSPEAKAKAALIRYLGSCWVCRSRRVPCPLEHHDVNALEAGLRAAQPTHRRERAQTQPDLTRPSVTTVSDGVGIGRSQSQHNLQPVSSYDQTVSLIGLGQQPDLLQVNFNSTGGSHSPVFADSMMDPLASIDAMSQYTSYQNGQMLRIGVHRGFFFLCQHLGGQCQQMFNNPEELQTHFETAHFAFTRIDPSHRYHCFGCENMSNTLNGPCLVCGLPGPKEVWIYGSFIRASAHERFAPDGQDFYPFLDDPFLNTTYSGDLSPDMDLSPGNNGGFDMNFGDFDQDFYQSNSTYQAPGSGPGPRGNSLDAHIPQQGNFQFRGTQFGKAGNMDSVYTRDWFTKVLPTCRRHKLILIVTTLLLAAICTTKTRFWFIGKARAIPAHSKLPIVSFVGLVISLALCHTYLKHSYFQQGISFRWRRTRCPLNDLSNAPMTTRPAAPQVASYIRSGISL